MKKSLLLGIVFGCLLSSNHALSSQRINVDGGVLSGAYLQEVLALAGKYKGKMKKMKSVNPRGFLGLKGRKVLIPKVKGHFLLSVGSDNRPVLQFVGDAGQKFLGGRCDSQIGDLVALEASLNKKGEIKVAELIFDLEVRNCQFKKKIDRNIIGKTLTLSFSSDVVNVEGQYSEVTKVEAYFLRFKYRNSKCDRADDLGRCVFTKEWYEYTWHEGKFFKKRKLR